MWLVGYTDGYEYDSIYSTELFVTHDEKFAKDYVEKAKSVFTNIMAFYDSEEFFGSDAIDKFSDKEWSLRFSKTTQSTKLFYCKEIEVR